MAVERIEVEEKKKKGDTTPNPRSPNNTAPHKAPMIWACNQCTYHNLDGKLEEGVYVPTGDCEMCGALRPAQKVEEAAHAQAEPLAESVNASGALNLPYLVEVRFPVLTQWLSAEVSLCQPENPMTFIHGLLKDKLALRKSARFEATEVDQYLEECLERPHLVTGGLEMSIPCVRSSFRLAFKR